MKVFYFCALVMLASAGCESDGDAANGSVPPDAADSEVKLDGGGPAPDGTDGAEDNQDITDASDDPVPADVPIDTAPPPAYALTGEWILTTICSPGIFDPVKLTMEPDGTISGEIDGSDGYQGWLRGEDFFLRGDYDNGVGGSGFDEYNGTAISSVELTGNYHYQSYNATGELVDEGTSAFTMQR